MCAVEMKKIKFTRSHSHYNIKKCKHWQTGHDKLCCNMHEQEKLLCFGVAQKPWKSIQDIKYRNEHL